MDIPKLAAKGDPIWGALLKQPDKQKLPSGCITKSLLTESVHLFDPGSLMGVFAWSLRIFCRRHLARTVLISEGFGSPSLST